MDKVILYPALVDYIMEYCSEFKTDSERKAERHNFALEKFGHSRKEEFYTHFKKNGFISADPDVLELLKEGYQTFRETVASRIYSMHQNELHLNLCPMCLKIARTPWARQCRFCFHSWHKKEEQ